MRKLLFWLVFVAIATLLVLGISGQWGDPMLRAYVAVAAAVALLGAAIVPEDTARARHKRGPAGADPVSPLVFRSLALGHIVAGALDARWHWSDGVPVGLRAAGLAVFAVTMSFGLWAVAVNRFFIPAVRIQEERGHQLVTSGPYAWVRHPGYASMVWAMPASGLGLGSWTAFALALVFSLVVLRRAALEDRFVTENLPGYGEYAARVRFRLIPGVW